MGVTGASGFPCCGKESVDIVDTQGSKNQPQFQLVQEEDELEKELLELEPPHKVGLDLEPELELEVEPKAEDSEQLKYRIESLQPDTLPDPQPDTQPDTQLTRPDTQPDTQPDISQWSIRPNSSYLSSAEEDQVSTNHRSICVQTSKHLFWADKLIQASEHSLERMTDTQLGKNKGKTISHLGQQSVPKDTTCSKKQLQTPSAQPAPPATDSQQLPNPYPSSSSLSPAIGLEELVNFASSLAVASSSKMDLPNLEHMIKAPPQKAEAPSTDPTTQVAVDQPEKKKLTKELPDRPPLKARESQKAQKPQDKNFSHPYLDFSKPGIKRATIKGEVKLLQPPAMSPLPQGDMKDSVPGTRKGSPLLLKIHFKVSSPTSPEK
uniref:Spermatogenesis associated 32 n=2 Tax=Canis lupus familiaris TaxID=9615 RepID=A0A8C0SF76_CANLF